MKQIKRNIIIILSLILVGTIVVFKLIESLSQDSTELTIEEHFPLDKTRSLPSFDYAADQSRTEEFTRTSQVKEKWIEKDLDPNQWGENVSGVKNRLNTNEKVMALTFDACGGPLGNKYDEELISFLREENIPATLFINARWIEENEEVFLELSEDDLFTIENHGTKHLPLSLTGRQAWGITGTRSVEEVIDEVMINQELIYSLTNRKPSFFRSGTAYYDEAAVAIIEDLGLIAVNFNILGDAGATYSSLQVTEALLQGDEGSIALLHMNQPDSGTAEGVMEAIPLLMAQGYIFVHLDDYELKE